MNTSTHYTLFGEDEERKNEHNGLLGLIAPDLSIRESREWIHERKCKAESMDFDEMESVMWRKHQLRRFFQDRGNWWTGSRRTTAYKWILVILTGFIIGCMGVGVQTSIDALIDWKFGVSNKFINNNNWAASFFSYLGICLAYSLVAGLLCWIEPAAAGSGIPEIKAYLNGVNLNKVVRIKVLITKVIGMCFSVAAGLPLGKEGPMIHTGSIVGAAVSQGKTLTFGFDTSWTKFQDLRNDRSKRDFVTFGASAGVAAAFSAPIGGILFTLEEGASFWSTNLTFRSFFCAMMTMLTVSVLYNGFTLGKTVGAGFQFGSFDNANYRMYELIVFSLMGAAGGVMGAAFNRINEYVSVFRMRYYDSKWKKLTELLVITFFWTLITFILPLCWQICTPIPTQTATWTTQEFNLLNKLVQFQCKSNEYNEVASLYFVNSDTAMQQLYHYLEVDGSEYATFGTGALLFFVIPYYLVAAVTSGTFAPAGLFVPTLLSGAAFGRIVGHVLNRSFPGFVASSGTYALIGAAAMLGGMARMTIAGAVIILEACGNSTFLLPLMLTFAAARYAGNAINEPMYDMQIRLKEMPFLEGSLRTLGLLNYHPVAEVMASPVVTLSEVMRVSEVYEILKATKHNGFPVLSSQAHLRGLVLRKTLCALLKHKIFSVPEKARVDETIQSVEAGRRVQLAPAGTLFHDTLERNYPRFTKIEEISLTLADLNAWLDVRPYMDTAPYCINESASVQRSYRLFRTMGLRHLIVINDDHKVTGILTRHDLTEHRLEHHWFQEGDNMQKFINVDPMPPIFVDDDEESNGASHRLASVSSLVDSGIQLHRQGRRESEEESPGAAAFAKVGAYVAPVVSEALPPPPLAGPAPTSATKAPRQKVLKEPKTMRSNK